MRRIPFAAFLFFLSSVPWSSAQESARAAETAPAAKAALGACLCRHPRKWSADHDRDLFR